MRERPISTLAWAVVLLAASAASALAQRQMEPLGRGVVAVRSATAQAYVSWRLFATDPADIRFNVFRSVNGGVPAQINALPITNTTDYVDATASFAVSNAWFVQPVIGNVAQPLSAGFGLAANSPVRQYIPIPLQAVIGGANPPYDVKFCWVGDLDGDGEYDYVVDRISTTANVRQYLQAYRRDGTFLWQIDMGPNSTLTSGNSTIVYEPSSSAISVGDKDNVTVYDMDGDGRAEVLVRTANGVVFGDGSILTAGANDSVQFLSVVDGMSGAEITRATVPNPFISDGPLNSNAGILYGDGVRPYVFLSGENRVGSGAFQRIVTAWSYQNGQLTQRWSRPVPGGVNESRGHQVRMADVDHDGIDELVQIGSAFHGGTGQPLYDTEVVHGDRYHLTDMDPDRPGLETYVIQQNNPTLLATALIDAQSGQLYKKWYAGGIVDVGRGDALDLDSRHRGVEVFSTQPGIFDARGNQIPGATAPWPYLGIWWEADHQREIFGAADGNGFSPVINKWNALANSSSRLYSIYTEGVHTAFGGRPAMFGDLFGDWREEFVVVANDYSEIRVYTTKIPATNRIYCLMQNPAYRIQCTAKGYYQASYPDFYLGEQMQPPGPPPAADSRLVWRGNLGTNWDTVTANWFTNRLWISNGTPVTFYSGDTVLFDLTGSNTAAITLTGVLTPGDVTVHAPKDYTFAGAGSMAGSMKLVKAGRGRLTLSGTNTFGGGTTVWEGAIVVDGSLPNSPVTVRGGVWLDGAIAGRGVIGAGVTVHRGGSVSPGSGASAAGTLTISNGLTLVDGARGRFDLSDDPSGLVKTNDLLRVFGNLTLSGTNEIHVTAVNGVLMPGGVYPLIQYSGALIGSAGNLRLRGLDGIPAYLTNAAGEIALVVKSTRPATTLTWTGGQNGNSWDLATSTNWLNGGAKDYFVSMDAVRFDNLGSSNTTVNLAESLITGPVVVDSTATYSFNGTGAIIGPASLSKSNSGTLTLNVLNNTYSGRTLVAGGTLIVPELDAVGYPSPLGNPPGGSTNLVLTGGSTLRITGESYTDRGLTVSSGTNSLEVANAADQVTIAGQITGAGALQKTGAGTLALTVSNSHSGGTIIKSGAVSLGSVAGNQYGVGSGGVTLDGGRLSMIDIQAGELCPWSIRVPLGSSGRLDCDGRSTLSGSLTGGGDFTVFLPYVRTDFSGNWSAFTGQILAITDGDGGNFRCLNTAGYPNARLNLGSAVSLQNRISGTPTIPIGELSGAPGANLAAPGGNDGLAVNWSVGGLNTSVTYSGNTFNGVGLIKVGSGTWTLAGATISHAGQTTVNGGTLLINGNAGAATGPVTVGAGGTLGGVGAIGGATLVNGRLSPGANGIGTLTFSNNVTLAGGSTTWMEINKSAGARDLAQAGGTLTYGGTLVVSNVSGALMAGDSFKLFDAAAYAGGFSAFNLPVLPSTLLWDTGALTTSGTLTVVTNPAASGPQNLVWKGDGGPNVWESSGAENWLTTGGAVTFFNPNDSVSFTDAGSNNVPVVLKGALTPSALTVNAAQDYILTGSGSIAGTNALVKSGSGTLTLTTSNSYAGDTLISGGAVRLVSLGAGLKHRWSFNSSLADTAGGQAASVVEVGANNVTLGAEGITLSGGARASSDYVSLGSNLLPNDAMPVTLQIWATQNAVQNWSRIFDFGASTAENVMMSWSQGTTLASDRVEWKDAATATVDNSNQPYTLGVEFHIAMVIEPGAGANGSTRVTWYRAPAAGGILGAARGSFETANTLADFNDTSCWLGRSQYTADNTASATYNEVRVWNRALSASELQVLHSAGPDAMLTAAVPAGTGLVLSGPAAVFENESGARVEVSSLAGAAGSEVKLGSGGLLAGLNGVSSSFSGSITGTNGLVKAGPGVLTLAGANAYSGETIVSNGTLQVNGSIANSLVAVRGGILSGDGWMNGPLSVWSGATLSPGSSLGMLTVSNTVALSAGSALLIELGGVPLTNDVLRTTVPLTLAGQLVVTNVSGGVPSAGSRFPVLSAPGVSAAFAGVTLPVLPVGLAWNTTRLATDGSIWVLSTTPPKIDAVSLTPSGFSMRGSGGTPGWNYRLLSSTNLATPLSQWVPVTTNQFDVSGNFVLTNAISPSVPREFFRIQVE